MTIISKWGNLALLPASVQGILLIATAAYRVSNGRSVVVARGRIALLVAALNCLVCGFIRNRRSTHRPA